MKTPKPIETSDTLARAKKASRELRVQLRTMLTEVEGLRDDLRVRIHLAGMDLRDAWSKLETRYETLAAKARHERDDALAALVQGFEDLRKELHALRVKLDASRPA
jgi:hypothetical protein